MIRLSGRGHQQYADKPAGDVMIQVMVLDHAKFERHGDDLAMLLDVDFVTAILGGTSQVTTIDGDLIEITIPEGSDSGKQLRVKGKGLPNMNTKVRGDLYCVMRAVLPKTVTAEQRKILEKYRDG